MSDKYRCGHGFREGTYCPDCRCYVSQDKDIASPFNACKHRENCRALQAKVAELERENEELREAASKHISALSAWQYAQKPVPKLPEVAPTANALARLLEQGGEQ